MNERLMRRVRQADGSRVWEVILSREMFASLVPELTEEQLDEFDWPLRLAMKPLNFLDDAEPRPDT